MEKNSADIHTIKDDMRIEIKKKLKYKSLFDDVYLPSGTRCCGKRRSPKGHKRIARTYKYTFFIILLLRTQLLDQNQTFFRNGWEQRAKTIEQTRPGCSQFRIFHGFEKWRGRVGR